MIGLNHCCHFQAAPEDVHQALTQRVSEWRSSDFDRREAQVGDEFTIRSGSTFKTMRTILATAPEKVAWLCVAQRVVMPQGMDPLRNEAEWVRQTIHWSLHQNGTGTSLSLLHEGLTPFSECWAVCEPGWHQTLQSLELLLETGAGRPFRQLDEDHLARAREVANRG